MLANALILAPAVLFAAWVMSRERGHWVERSYRADTDWLLVLAAVIILIAAALLAAIVA